LSYRHTAKPRLEATVSVAQEMRSHARRIRIFRESDRSEVLGIYSDVGFGKDVLAEIEPAGRYSLPRLAAELSEFRRAWRSKVLDGSVASPWLQTDPAKASERS
jgi:hypothetical protein